MQSRNRIQSRYCIQSWNRIRYTILIQKMFVYTWKCIRLAEILAEPKIRLYFRTFFQYMNAEESLSIKGWTVFLHLYAPKCIEFCHISYRWKIAKIFHRWNPWDSAVPAVLHIFPNEKSGQNHTSIYFL